MVTLADAPVPADTAGGPPPPVLDVAVPVYNEERILERSVRRLRHFLDEEVPWSSVVTVVDNGSTDATAAVADRLAARLDGVRVVHLGQKGRGLALRTAWGRSEAAVVAYMDVDLSTDLRALLPLVAPLVSGHSDVAIGSRLARGARVVRGPKRELVSRSYNILLKACLHNGFTDAQCGFKAVRADVVRRLLPDVADNRWFFDTELLVLAERSTLRIHEVPVDWVDDPDSRVHIVQTAADDLRGVARLLRHRARLDRAGTAVGTGAVASRFARVGIASTAVYLGLFFALRPVAGLYGANAAALAVCTLGNAVANARFTFVRRRPLSRSRLVRAGACAFGVSLGVTSATLAACAELGLAAAPLALAAALVGANGLAAAARFVLLHAWMFRRTTTEEVTA